MSKFYPAPGPCPFSGYQTEGTIYSADEDVGGIPAYICKPYGDHVVNREGCGIVIFTDEDGIWHNPRMLADQFAAAGYHTIVPAYTYKVTAEGLGPNQTPDPTMPTDPDDLRTAQDAIIENAVVHLVGRGCTSIGAVGYGIGGLEVLRHLSADAPNEIRFQAGFIAHPIGAKQPNFAALQRPLSLAVGDSDEKMSDAARRAAINGLLASCQPYQVSLYSHVKQGFAVRRAFYSQADRFAKKQSFIQAITWFEEFLAVDKPNPESFLPVPQELQTL